MDEELAKKLAEHDKRFDAHDERFDRIEQRLDGHDKRFDAHDEQFLRMGIKLEKIESDIQLMLEAVTLQIDSFRRDLQSQIDVVNQRLDRLELAVQSMSRDLAFTMSAVQEISRLLNLDTKATEQNSAAIQEHSRQIQELREAVAQIDAKLDDEENRARVDGLENRVAALEAEVFKPR